MANATVNSRTTGVNNTALSAHTITNPASLSSQGVLVCFTNDVARAVVETSSTGWELLSQRQQGTTTNHKGSVFWAQDASAADDLVVDISGQDGAEEATWVVYVIDNPGVPVVAGSNGSDNSVEFPTATPAATGDNLCIIYTGVDTSTGASISVSSWPTDFINAQAQNPSGTSSAATFTAERSYTSVSSVSPGTATLSASEQHVEFTILFPGQESGGGDPGTGEITPRTPTVEEVQTSSIQPDTSTAQVGDFMLVGVSCDQNINTPSGWTLAFPQIDQVVNQAVFYRFKDGTANDSPTITTSSGTRLSAICQPFGGVDTDVPLDGVTPSVRNTGTGTTSAVLSAVTTNTDNAYAVTGFAIDASSSTYEATLSGTGWSEVAETTGTGRRQGMGLKAMPTAGSTGTATWAQSGGSLAMIGYQLALRPAPASEPSISTTNFFLSY